MVVLKPCKTIKNYLPEHFPLKDARFLIFSGIVWDPRAQARLSMKVGAIINARLLPSEFADIGLREAALL